MSIWRKIFRKHNPVAPQKPGMVCCECGARIHKHELYTVLSVRHKNCKDPKGVGQMQIEDKHPHEEIVEMLEAFDETITATAQDSDQEKEE